MRKSYIKYYSLVFFIAYAFKGQVHVFPGQVNIVSNTSCRTSAILKYFCPLLIGSRHFKHVSLVPFSSIPSKICKQNYNMSNEFSNKYQKCNRPETI